MTYVQIVLQFASVIAALFSAHYWYQSSVAHAPYVDRGQFVISDTDSKGQYDVLETAKIQVRLNKPAALWAAATAALQGLALIVHVIQ
jgi:hypothetical protein